MSNGNGGYRHRSWEPRRASAAVHASQRRAALAAGLALLLLAPVIAEGAFLYPRLPASLLVPWEAGGTHYPQSVPRNLWDAFSPLLPGLVWFVAALWVSHRDAKRKPVVERRDEVTRDLRYTYALAPAKEGLYWSAVVAVAGTGLDCHRMWHAWLHGSASSLGWGSIILVHTLTAVVAGVGGVVTARRWFHLGLSWRPTEEKGSVSVHERDLS